MNMLPESSTRATAHIESCCITDIAYCGAVVDRDAWHDENPLCLRCALCDAADWCGFCGSLLGADA